MEAVAFRLTCKSLSFIPREVKDSSLNLALCIIMKVWDEVEAGKVKRTVSFHTVRKPSELRVSDRSSVHHGRYCCVVAGFELRSDKVVSVWKRSSAVAKKSSRSSELGHGARFSAPASVFVTKLDPQRPLRQQRLYLHKTFPEAQ
jgi:hypothetical protein